MLNTHKQRALIVCMTPAALLAACSNSGRGWAWERQHTGPSPDYSQMGDTAENARFERDHMLANRDDTPYQSRGYYQTDANDQRRYDVQSWQSSSNGQNWQTSPNGQNWQVRSDGQNQLPPAMARNDNPSYDNSATGYNTGEQRTPDPSRGTNNDQNPALSVKPGWTQQEQVAANRAASDPATNPQNANAQFGRNEQHNQNPNLPDPQVRRIDGTLAGAGQERSVVDASPETRILSILHMKNQEEIEAGRLAMSKGSSDQIRQYGEHLVNDHTQADSKVTMIASNIHATLLNAADTKRLMHSRSMSSRPMDEGTRPDVNNPDQNPKPDLMETLKSKNSNEFDREFAVKMASGHRKLAKIIEDAQPGITDNQVRALLAELLPTIRMHERMARQLPAYDGRDDNPSADSPNDEQEPARSGNK